MDTVENYYKRKYNRRIKLKTPGPLETMEYMLNDCLSGHKKLLKQMIDVIKSANLKDPYLKWLFSELSKLEDRIIDLCAKMAPYRSAKLESIEVKSTIEHRMVMRAPRTIANVSEWAKQTGAEIAEINSIKSNIKDITPPAPSIHDFEDLDELETQRLLKESDGNVKH